MKGKEREREESSPGAWISVVRNVGSWINYRSLKPRWGKEEPYHSPSKGGIEGVGAGRGETKLGEILFVEREKRCRSLGEGKASVSNRGKEATGNKYGLRIVIPQKRGHMKNQSGVPRWRVVCEKGGARRRLRKRGGGRPYEIGINDQAKKGEGSAVCDV